VFVMRMLCRRKVVQMENRQVVEQVRESRWDARRGAWIGVLPRLMAVSVLVVAVAGMRPVTSVAAGRVTVCGGGCDYGSIEAAVAGISTGGMIDILDAEHTESGILVDKDVTIAGLGASDTIVQAHATRGAAAQRVFEIAAGAEVTIRDVTVRHGNVSGGSPQGGGILSRGTLTLERVAVRANDAAGVSGTFGGTARGGGVYSDGDLLVVDSTINANSAEGGAGDSVGGDGEGGGLFAGGGSARLLNVTISGNGVRKGNACGG